MPSRPLPLTALRAFDAAARHMSFALAAQELNVTPAALSFQIKSLEEHLGMPVFRRLNRAIELTDAGKRLAPGCQTGFSELGRAWAETLRMRDGSALTITAGPAFTTKWLAPRLYQFAQSHPEIDLRFDASLRLLDLERDQVDIAIRFSAVAPQQSTIWSHPFDREWLTPVMTPELARQFPTMADLRHAPLVSDQSLEFLPTPCGWNDWFKVAGLPTVEATGPKFSQADHAIDAAMTGGGVVLGRRSLIAQDLASGRLVAPYDVHLDTGARFFVLCRRGEETRPQIKAFLDWIRAELGNANLNGTDTEHA